MPAAFDDIAIGQVVHLGTAVVDADDLEAFCEAFMPGWDVSRGAPGSPSAPSTAHPAASARLAADTTAGRRVIRAGRFTSHASGECHHSAMLRGSRTGGWTRRRRASPSGEAGAARR